MFAHMAKQYDHLPALDEMGADVADRWTARWSRATSEMPLYRAFGGPLTERWPEPLSSSKLDLKPSIAYISLLVTAESIGGSPRLVDSCTVACN